LITSKKEGIMRFNKAQASFEYVILFGMFLAILMTVTFYSANEIGDYIKSNEIGDSAKTISRAVNQVSAIGPGSAKVITLKMPKGIVQGYTSYKSVVFSTYNKRISSDIHFPTKSHVYGLLETGKGTKYIIVKVMDNGYVSLSPLGHPNMTQGLVAYYSMQTLTSSQTLEATGLSNHGDIIGNVDCTDNGYVGKGCNFDGSAGTINITHTKNLNLTEDISISLWVNFNNVGANTQALVSKWEDHVNDNKSWIIQKDNTNKIEFRTSHDAVANHELESLNDVGAGRWYHIVALYNGSHKAIYIDGNLANSVAYTNGIYGNTNTSLEIGRRSEGTPNYLDAEIDEVMIFSRALTELEIKKLRLLGRTPE